MRTMSGVALPLNKEPKRRSRRYINGFEQGAPVDYYTRPEAERSIEDAQAVIQFCEDILAKLAGDEKKARNRRAADEGAASRD
jgi:hypothetical protein